MIPYYNPHLGLFDIIKSIFIKNSENKTIAYFSKYTSKKYVLITSSCRSALYLSYLALEKNGFVITSPLTCESAIDPIIWSENKPLFSDIDMDTLNMSIEYLKKLIPSNPIAIQLINHGGFASDENHISLIAKQFKVPLIIDCAQSFASTTNQRNSGFFADIACYSLIKNAYGIGGGILATDSQAIYEKAKDIQHKFNPFSKKVLLYRLIYSLLESKQNNFLLKILFRLLLYFKLNKINQNDFSDTEQKPEKFLRRPSKLFTKLFIARNEKMEILQEQRKKRGQNLMTRLILSGIAENFVRTNLKELSFTKLFVFNKKFDSYNTIDFLRQNSIDAKHLEQRDDARIQKRFDQGIYLQYNSNILNCHNYLKIHDSILSIPLTENMDDKEMDKIVEKLKIYLYENNMV